MTTTRATRPLLMIGTAFAAAALLAGCTSGSAKPTATASAVPTKTAAATPTSTPTPTADASGSSQTKAEACAEMKSQVQSVSQQIQANASELSSDPAKAVAAIDQLSSTFSTAVDGVTNDEVKSVAVPARDALSTFATDFDAIAANPSSADTSKFTTDAQNIQTTFQALGTTCSS